MSRPHEVDLSQLFSDVTRTVQGLRAIVAPTGLGEEITGGASSQLFPTCFKACGVEDVQLAAQVW